MYLPNAIKCFQLKKFTQTLNHKKLLKFSFVWKIEPECQLSTNTTAHPFGLLSIEIYPSTHKFENNVLITI